MALPINKILDNNSQNKKKTSVNNNDSDDSDAFDEEEFSDRTVFIISFVPIKLVADNIIVWQNK